MSHHDLIVDNALSSTAQAVKDKQGGSSKLFLSTGNVGVGSGDPHRPLDVFGNNSVEGALAATNSAGGQRVNIWVDETNSQGRIDSGGNGQIKLRINDGGGNVGVGGSGTISRRLDVFGDGTVGGALAATNSAGGQRVNIWVDETNSQGRIDSGGNGQIKLRINDGGGKVTLGGRLEVEGSGVQFSGLANLPSSGKVDLMIDSQGNVATQTSSERFKEKIKSLKADFHRILSLEPISFVDADSGEAGIGYRAEDLDEKELGKLVAYDGEGKPLSVHYKLLPIYLVEILKSQQALIKRLSEQLGKFEHRVECLEGSAG